MILFLKRRTTQAGILVAVSILLLCLPLIFSPSFDAAQEDKSAWLAFLGAFHPLFLHLPIGFLVLVFSLELYSIINKKHEFPMGLPLALNALAALAAALLGFIWYQTGQWPGETMESHLWQGLIFSVTAIWLPWIYLAVKDKRRILYQASLIGTVGVMFSAAHLGGESVHGDPLDKAPWNLKDKEEVSENPLVYEEIIVPILTQKCYSCHSSEKQKGGLRLDTIALMLDGGENDTALIIGDAMKSPMITSIHAPLDEKGVHMPPKGKPQVSSDELAILEWWVNQGAPEGKHLNDLKVPSEIAALIVADSGKITPVVDKQKSLSPAESPLAVSMRGYLEKFPNSILWTSKDIATLRFSASSLRTTYSDKDLHELKPFASELVELDFNGTAVTDKVVELVNSCSKLHTLKLGGTKITDKALEAISKHPNIRNLVLYSTQISDKGISHLSSMSSLKEVYLWGSSVSEEGVKELTRKLPECMVDTGIKVSKVSKPSKPSKPSKVSKATESSKEARSVIKADKLLKSEMTLKLSSRYNVKQINNEKFFLQGDYKGGNRYNIHTKKERGAWVTVDMLTEQNLTGLTIYNRPDVPERANRIEVLVSKNDQDWKSVFQSNGETTSKWEVKTNARARYIRIQINKEVAEYLHLRNISIYIK